MLDHDHAGATNTSRIYAVEDNTLKSEQFITIDPPSSKDLDDGFYIERTGEHWQVCVYVACPALGIKDKPQILQDALKRGQTRYHAKGNTPMLDRTFEQQYSLTPSGTKDALKIRIVFTDALDILDVELSVVQAQSIKRWSYAEVSEALKSDDAPGQLVWAALLAKALLAKRQKHGALVFLDEERGMYLDSETLKVKVDDSIISHVIVQEMMVLANSCASSWCKARGCHVLWRVHEAKNEDAPALLQKKFARALEDEDMEAFSSIKQQMGWMSHRATYETSAGVHYGLAIEDYMHLTSPLRRAADLVSQLQILAYLNHEPLVFLPQDLADVSQLINQTNVTAKQTKNNGYINKDDQKTLSKDVDEVAKDQRLFSRCVAIHCKNPDAMTGSELLEIFERALAHDTIITGTLYQLLLCSHDTHLQQRVLSHVIEHPFMATIAVQQAEQADDWFDEVACEQVTSYTTPLFVDQALGIYALNKKALTQRAYLVFLARRMALEHMVPSDWFEMPEGLVKRKKSKAHRIKLPNAPSPKSVGVLFEWSQIAKVTLDFEYERDGELWRCVLKTTWQDELLEAQFSAQNKNLAKQHVCHELGQQINTMA